MKRALGVLLSACLVLVSGGDAWRAAAATFAAPGHGSHASAWAPRVQALLAAEAGGEAEMAALERLARADAR